MRFSIITFLCFSVLAVAAPFDKRASFTKSNGEQAQALQEQFSNLTPDSSCQTGQNACINGQFAQCVDGKFQLTPCGAGLKCQVLPLVNSAGTSVTCDTDTDAQQRVQNTGAKRYAKRFPNNSKQDTFDVDDQNTGAKRNAKRFPNKVNNNKRDFLDADVDAQRVRDRGAKRFVKASTKRSPHRTNNKRASFTKSNGQQAEALKAQFAQLTPDSPCQTGQNACINGQFAQCAGGKFQLTPCGAGLECQVLPLVNSAGTSVTCDTSADAQTRVQNTDAKRSTERSGKRSSKRSGKSSSKKSSAKRSTRKANKRASFTKSNGEQAEALKAQFAQLTPDSPCQTGQNACINGQFAQCASGKFQLTPCGAGLECQVLPLVNSPGTSVTCDTAADDQARLQSTGAKRSTKRSGKRSSKRSGKSSSKKSSAKRSTRKANKRASFTKSNGEQAEALKSQFSQLTPDSPCQPGQNACINDQFAQCVGGKFQLTPCGAGLKCQVLPLVNSAGTSVTCDTDADSQRVQNTGAKRDYKQAVPIHKRDPGKVIPLNRRDHGKVIPLNEREPGKAIPINKRDQPNVIPLNQRDPGKVVPLNQRDHGKVIPINKRDHPKDIHKRDHGKVIPLNQRDPGKVPINKRDHPKDILVNKRDHGKVVPLNDRDSGKVIPINKRHQPKVVPIHKRDYGKVIPLSQRDRLTGAWS